VVRKADYPVGPDDLADRVFQRLAGLLIDDLENTVQWTADGLVLVPSCQVLSDRVEESYDTFLVRCYDRIANAFKGRQQPTDIVMVGLAVLGPELIMGAHPDSFSQLILVPLGQQGLGLGIEEKDDPILPRPDGKEVAPLVDLVYRALQSITIILCIP
jgi:hypothetical protein